MKYDQEELFSSLVESAFEFLNKALDEFEESPKFSTVNFAVAVELFLKSRLMREHWSLLIEKTDSADRNQFFQGSSKTINPDTAVQRLAKIAGDPVPEDARKAFQAIAKHRNRMVHFVHGGFKRETQKDQAELEQVVAEQCHAWRQLQVLLEKNWASFFEDFKTDIASIEQKMQRHREYLKAKFDSKSKEIEEHQKSYGSVRFCRSCGFDSVLVSLIDGAISSASCVVCWFSGSVVSLECATYKCHQKIEFDSFEGPPEHCLSCSAPIAAWVPEALNTGEAITKDNYFDHVDMSCAFCGGYHSVVEHFDGFTCTKCFEYSTTMEICGWCNEGQLGGVSEISYVTGCEFCEGKIGWDND